MTMKPIKRNVLFNPGPATTTDSVKIAQVVPDICPREDEFTQVMMELCDKILEVVHANKDEYASVLFCGSGTICMDACINSLLDDTGKILILDNGAYSERAFDICCYYNLPCYHLSYLDNLPINTDEVGTFLDEHRDVKVVYVTHQETGTGLLNPIREIGECAHKHNAVLVVDTTSTYAMLPINVRDDNIDFCMASAQKGIMGMTGLSFVIGKRNLIEESGKFPRRSYYCNLFRQYDYFEKTGQMHFTPPVQTVYAARQALVEYFEEGEESKWFRHRSVYNALCDGLARLGFKSYLKQKYEAGLVTTALYPDDSNWDFDFIHDYCYTRGYTIYPGKISNKEMFRLCALGAITPKDVESFFVVFKKALIEAGVKVPVQYN